MSHGTRTVYGGSLPGDPQRPWSYTWAQVAAWLGGAALWIAPTFAEWLIRGRRDLPQPFIEIPGDTARKKLTGA